ncbi:MAG: hypothetical protein AB4038_11185 [Prochloraceae cyanobacterium]
MLTGLTAKAAIGGNFVARPHLELIQKVCEAKKMIVSIRETGNHSIRRIEAGYACKPHQVLEKSVKQSSLDAKVDSTLRNALIPQIRRLDLYGFIGHWGKDTSNRDTLLGIRTITTHEHQLRLLDANGNPTQRAARQNYANEKELHRNKTWVSLNYIQTRGIPEDALTGDYDTHDLLYNYNGRGIKKGQRIFGDSLDESRIIDEINSTIFDGIAKYRLYYRNDLTDGMLRGFITARKDRAEAYDADTIQAKTRDNPFSVIQHGPQQAWATHVLGKGKEYLTPSLIAYDVPLAVFGDLSAFGQQGPIIIEREDELENLYRSIGGKIWPEQVKTFEQSLPYIKQNLSTVAGKKRSKDTKTVEKDTNLDTQQRKARIKTIDLTWAKRLNAWDYWIVYVLRNQRIAEEFEQYSNSNQEELLIQNPQNPKLLTSNMTFSARSKPDKDALKFAINDFVLKTIKFYQSRLEKKQEAEVIGGQKFQELQRQIDQLILLADESQELRDNFSIYLRQQNEGNYVTQLGLVDSFSVPSNTLTDHTAFDENDILINGMKVVFNQSVATTPVELESTPSRRSVLPNRSRPRY